HDPRRRHRGPHRPPLTHRRPADPPPRRLTEQHRPLSLPVILDVDGVDIWGRADRTVRLKTFVRQNWRCPMSSAAEEFEVDAQLAAWLDRHGVHARTGDRVRLELVPPPAKADPAYVDELWDAFIGSSHSDDPDLAFRAKEIVREEAATPDVL